MPCVGSQNKACAMLAHYLNRCWHIMANSSDSRLGLGGRKEEHFPFPLKEDLCFLLHPRAPPALEQSFGVPGPLETEPLSPEERWNLIEIK